MEKLSSIESQHEAIDTDVGNHKPGCVAKHAYEKGDDARQVEEGGPSQKWQVVMQYKKRAKFTVVSMVVSGIICGRERDNDADGGEHAEDGDDENAGAKRKAAATLFQSLHRDTSIGFKTRRMTKESNRRSELSFLNFHFH